MKKLLIALSFLFCMSNANAQYCYLSLGFDGLGLEVHNATEVLGVSLMSVGTCMLEIALQNPDARIDPRSGGLGASGAILLAGGFIVYMTGLIRHDRAGAYNNMSVEKT